MRSHGSHWNGLPLRVGELTLGDYLSTLGVRTVLVGKTHMAADLEGMARLGIDPDSMIGVHVAECGFDPFERDDGLQPDGAIRASRATTIICANSATTATNPWERLGQLRRGRGRQPAVRLAAAHADMPRACRKSIPRRPT